MPSGWLNAQPLAVETAAPAPLNVVVDEKTLSGPVPVRLEIEFFGIEMIVGRIQVLIHLAKIAKMVSCSQTYI